MPVEDFGPAPGGGRRETGAPFRWNQPCFFSSFLVVKQGFSEGQALFPIRKVRVVSHSASVHAKLHDDVCRGRAVPEAGGCNALTGGPLVVLLESLKGQHHLSAFPARTRRQSEEYRR